MPPLGPLRAHSRAFVLGKKLVTVHMALTWDRGSHQVSERGEGLILCVPRAKVVVRGGPSTPVEVSRSGTPG